MALAIIPLDEISEPDLQRLIENKVPESRELEFKRDPYGRSDAAKKEFLKDVSAMANTAGGDLVIGIDEAEGIASSLIGITSSSADEEVRRLEAILQDGLEPRLIGTRIRPVTIAAGGYALVVRIQRSWNAPHRVVFQGSNRFYGRNAGGAFELGVEQLRVAFFGPAETERRLLDFRLERLARLKAGIGTGLYPPGALVLHIAPLQSPASGINVRDAAQDGTGFCPMGMCSRGPSFNFDGLLVVGPSDERAPQTAFVQVFRNGRLEAGRGAILFDRELCDREVSEAVSKHLRYEPLGLDGRAAS